MSTSKARRGGCKPRRCNFATCLIIAILLFFLAVIAWAVWKARPLRDSLGLLIPERMHFVTSVATSAIACLVLMLGGCGASGTAAGGASNVERSIVQPRTRTFTVDSEGIPPERLAEYLRAMRVEQGVPK